MQDLVLDLSLTMQPDKCGTARRDGEEDDVEVRSNTSHEGWSILGITFNGLRSPPVLIEELRM